MPNISENEVEKAIQRCQLYVGKHYNEGGGNDLKDAINTLIRAAQSAPVDLERVRGVLTDVNEMMASFAKYPANAGEMKRSLSMSERVEEILKLLPTTSKE